MKTPLQVSFHSTPHSDALESYVRKHAEKLETFFGRIVGCRVVLEVPHRARSGGQYGVRINLNVPGEEIAVTHVPEESVANEDPYAAVDRAFAEAGRRLGDYAQRKRGDVKPHEHHRRARVKRLFAHEGYGFLETAEGEDVYFHRNAVLNEGFDRMRVGSDVTFVEEAGEKGPQASTVALRRHRGATT
jgi:cold shock CspA family protein